jgi:hypothetical protein
MLKKLGVSCTLISRTRRRMALCATMICRQLCEGRYLEQATRVLLETVPWAVVWLEAFTVLLVGQKISLEEKA